MAKKIRDVASLARSGGVATLKKYGPDHFSKIAKAKWRAYRKAKKQTEAAKQG